jgi:hypothetical protein
MSLIYNTVRVHKYFFDPYPDVKTEWVLAADVTVLLESRRGLLEAMSIQSTVYIRDHANVLIWVKGS